MFWSPPPVVLPLSPLHVSKKKEKEKKKIGFYKK